MCAHAGLRECVDAWMRGCVVVSRCCRLSPVVVARPVGLLQPSSRHRRSSQPSPLARLSSR